MTGKTHASCGMLVGALTTQYFQTDIFSSVTVIILATLASLLPDICHTQSKIGRRFKIISFFCEIDLWTSNLYAFNIIYRNHSIFIANYSDT